MQKEAFSKSYILCQHEATDDVISVTVGFKLGGYKMLFLLWWEEQMPSNQNSTLQWKPGTPFHKEKKKNKQTVFYRLCHVKVVFPLSSELIIEKECHDFETNYFSFRPNLPSSLFIVFLKNLVVIWMRNVPFSLRHLQTWSPVGAVWKVLVGRSLFVEVYH